MASMESSQPVISDAVYCLAHVPDLVRFGSKPRRELSLDPLLDERLTAALRSFSAAAAYPPNRVFIGDLAPAELKECSRPWFQTTRTGPAEPADSACGAFGNIISQRSFLQWLKWADVLHPPLFELSHLGVEKLVAPDGQPVPAGFSSAEWTGVAEQRILEEIRNEEALPITIGSDLVGCFRRDNRAEGRGDPSLSAHHLLEALAVKASGALALSTLLDKSGLGADEIDYVISCGEEACGDRYQRGGGGMAKSIGELCGCVNASGMDVKNFCAAPASALVSAAALVQSGLYQRVAVVAGGSLAKLGMKFEAFLGNGIPILDDCLAAMAFLITRDDQQSPIFQLKRGSIGLAAIGASTSDEAVYRNLILKPLETLGLTMADVDKYAPELHNPEIMQFAGSGDVTQKNYRMIAALAVLDGQIEKSDMTRFVEQIGMSGFAPTQGHIPSAVPYLGHALGQIRSGEINRAMFLCKASLFLNRITELFDGVSFIVEQNPGASG